VYMLLTQLLAHECSRDLPIQELKSSISFKSANSDLPTRKSEYSVVGYRSSVLCIFYLNTIKYGLPAR
jgi:hypothetical protein